MQNRAEQFGEEDYANSAVTEPHSSRRASSSLVSSFSFVFLRVYFRVAGPFNGLQQSVRLPLMIVCLPVAAILALVIWPAYLLFEVISNLFRSQHSEGPGHETEDEGRTE